MQKVGLVGWRGMVGSVLLQRMQEEEDFKYIKPVFFSTSAEAKLPDLGLPIPSMQDSACIESLREMDIIISCQGGDYTQQIHPQLRQSGWKGYWIDAASTLRMENSSTIILDPINSSQIEQALARGVNNFIGGNCTVSLMLMAIGGLFKEDLIEWLSVMSYQAASGAGAQALRELLLQQAALLKNIDLTTLQQEPILNLERAISQKLKQVNLPVEQFKVPLAANVLPWVDREVEDGQTREEWKGMAETNKILGADRKVPIDGICVRVPSLRCHAQALTLKLKKNIELSTVESLIENTTSWTSCVENNQLATLSNLTPAAVAGTLAIRVGRIRYSKIGDNCISLFTVGDQLLWGAAEPLRRMLRILI